MLYCAKINEKYTPHQPFTFINILTFDQVVVMLVITDQTVPFLVLQTVRRGDVTLTRDIVLAAYRDIRV